MTLNVYWIMAAVVLVVLLVAVYKFITWFAGRRDESPRHREEKDDRQQEQTSEHAREHASKQAREHARALGRNKSAPAHESRSSSSTESAEREQASERSSSEQADAEQRRRHALRRAEEQERRLIAQAESTEIPDNRPVLGRNDAASSMAMPPASATSQVLDRCPRTAPENSSSMTREEDAYSSGASRKRSRTHTDLSMMPLRNGRTQQGIGGDARDCGRDRGRDVDRDDLDMSVWKNARVTTGGGGGTASSSVDYDFSDILMPVYPEDVAAIKSELNHYFSKSPL